MSYLTMTSYWLDSRLLIATMLAELYDIDTAANAARPVETASNQAPVTGFDVTVADAITALVLNPAGTLATGAVKMAANPVDNQPLHLFSTQTVSTLTVTANTGQTLLGAATTITSAKGCGWKYNLSLKTWFRTY